MAKAAARVAIKNGDAKFIHCVDCYGDQVWLNPAHIASVELTPKPGQKKNTPLVALVIIGNGDEYQFPAKAFQVAARHVLA